MWDVLDAFDIVWVAISPYRDPCTSNPIIYSIFAVSKESALVNHGSAFKAPKISTATIYISRNDSYIVIFACHHCAIIDCNILPVYMTTLLKPYLHIGFRTKCRSQLQPLALKSAYSSWADTVKEGLYGSMAEGSDGEKGELRYADVC